MKLLKTQYQDILSALDELSIAHERLSLVKKRGRIKIQIENINSSFYFFRRKSVSITTEHQWEKSEHYEVTIDGKVSVTMGWDQVMVMIKSWLSSKNISGS
jgi:hypothetical protein